MEITMEWEGKAMLHRFTAWIAGIIFTFSFTCTSLAFDSGSLAAPVSASPDAVYEFYLGQSFDDFNTIAEHSDWLEFTRGISSEGGVERVYKRERMPGLWETMVVSFGHKTNQLKFLSISFVGEDGTSTKGIADYMYQNLSEMKMNPVGALNYGKDSRAEWTNEAKGRVCRVRMEYRSPVEMISGGVACVTRFIEKE